MSNPSIQVEIGANADKLSKGLSDAQKKLQDFSQQALAVGKGLSLAVTTPIVGIGIAAIKSASDTEESFSKFGTVFRDVSEQAETSFGILRNEYGLSSLAAKTLLGDTGDLLTGFGFSQTAALDLATEVNKLAVDLASFTNFSGGAKGASEALTKALLGERESVKALGISILEEDVKKQVAINSAKGLTFETERQAKAYATLDLAIAQSGNAIGDYARTSDSFANQLRLVQSRLSDLAVEFGQVLLPTVTKLANFINDVIQRFSGLDDSTKKIIIVVAGLAAAIGPLLVVLGTLGAALPAIAAGFAALTGPIGLVTLAVGAAVGLLIKLNLELAKTEDIAKNVRLETLAKSINEINDAVADQTRINLKFFPSLTEEEAKLKAVNQLIEQQKALYISSFKAGNQDSEKLNGQLQRLIDIRNELTNQTTAQKELGQATKLTFEEFSKLSDIRNEEVFRRWNEEAEKYNATIAESAALQNRLKSSLQDVVKQIDGKSIFEIGDIGGTAPKIEIPEIDTSFKTQLILALEESKEALLNFSNQAQNIVLGLNSVISQGLTNIFTDLGQSIGQALIEGENVISALGGSLLKSIGGFLSKLGGLLISFGVATKAFAITQKALIAGDPITKIAAAGTLIGIGVGLAALGGGISALASKGASGGSGSGVSTGLTGGSGQSFGNQTQSLQSFDRQEQLVATVRGGDLLFTIQQAQRKNR